MSLTQAQRAAIDAEGPTLVVAGAGTGKTRTLIERCLRLLFGARQIGLDRLLIVTFTEAAAAEMRHRLRAAIEARQAEPGQAERCALHLARLDAAQISTLHSFCYRLVRENFGELGTDPTAAVLTEDQARVLAAETLEELFAEHYRNAQAWSEDVHRLLRDEYRGWDSPLGETILRLHEHAQTRPDPERWLAEQAEMWSQENSPWKERFVPLIGEWRARWIPALEAAPADNQAAATAAAMLRRADSASLAALPGAVAEFDKAGKMTWPYGKKDLWRPPFKKFFDEAAFLAAFTPETLDEDWRWAQPSVRTLLRLVEQYALKFAEAKRERAVLDFHDLEQFSLRLLCEPESGEPTALARRWQGRFDAVFVDEFQDINPAQDLILRCVSSSTSTGGRFLVGDIKQSIYGFRQADPRIFARYLDLPETSGWQKIYLSDNFRSRESILGFVNGLFGRFMRRELGGVDYDSATALRFGNPDGRTPLSARHDPAPSVEFHLRLKPDGPSPAPETTEDDDAEADIGDAEWEARLAARRLRELHGTPFYDEATRAERSLEWSDMAVLLRAAGPKAETWAKAFESFGVPLALKRDVFYATEEIRDLIDLLTLLDNPIQDIPLLGALRSPFGGFAAVDLAEIRMTDRAAPLWVALARFHETRADHPAWPKARAFLERLQGWRNLHRSASIRERLEVILADTGYAEWLLGRPRGRQRYANVRQFLELARDFDRLRGENLYRFLRHLEQVQESAGDIEPAAASGVDAIRLMSVHQSKGLEFPVVLVADLAKRWNQRDSSQRLLLDDELGLCPTIKPPGAVRRYPSLAHWAAQRRRKTESLGEEMRILYVALTRPRHRLILTATATEKTLKSWSESGSATVDDGTRSSSWLSWIGPHLAALEPAWPTEENAPHGEWMHRLYRDDALLLPPSAPPLPCVPEISSGAATDLELEARLNFRYPHELATRQIAKTSVTALRRSREAEEEAAILDFLRAEAPRRSDAASGPAAAARSREKGEATHIFLEHLDLRQRCDLANLHAQAGAFVQSGRLAAGQISELDLPAIAAFWKSEIGTLLREHRSLIRRELPFAVRLPAAADLPQPALPEIGVGPHVSPLDHEWVVLQGVVDLAVIHPSEIWLLDYKTDDVPPGLLESRLAFHRPQLDHYRRALAAIFRRPVTRTWLHFLLPHRTFSI